MKNQVDEQKLRIGDLGLQITFKIYGTETLYRTITYPDRSGNKYWGTRACLNLLTNKAERLHCSLCIFHVEQKD
jgi:hypothetical protein